MEDLVQEHSLVTLDTKLEVLIRIFFHYECSKTGEGAPRLRRQRARQLTAHTKENPFLNQMKFVREL